MASGSADVLRAQCRRVSVAARMEPAPAAGEVMLSDPIYSAARTQFPFPDLEKRTLELRGKEEPTRAPVVLRASTTEQL